MRILLLLLLGLMLTHPQLTMDSAGAACRLFVQSVLPGLWPYMTLCLLLLSRMGGRMPAWLLMLLGWCGGSPTGARLMALHGLKDKRLAVSCATMSPMFLLGTLGSWLDSPAAGMCILPAVLLGGWLVSRLARPAPAAASFAAPAPLSLGDAAASSAATMLMVCGTMVVLRVVCDLLCRLLPGLTLPIATLLEVTSAARTIAELPLPLLLRTAMLAGAAGMGGSAVLLQNRACCPGLMPLWEQALWQLLHGAVSFILALGMGLMAGI